MKNNAKARTTDKNLYIPLSIVKTYKFNIAAVTHIVYELVFSVSWI